MSRVMAHERRSEPVSRPGLRAVAFALASGALLAIVAAWWWFAYAPLAYVEVVADLFESIVNADGEDGFDGAMVMPIMVGAAITAALAGWAAVTRRPSAAAVAAASWLLVAIASGTAIDRVVGSMRLVGPEEIAAMPFAPAGIIAWVFTVLAVVPVLTVVAVRADPWTSIAISTLLAAFYFACTVRLSDAATARAGEGFAALVLAAGLWLAVVILVLRRVGARPRWATPVE